jgi:hypothetical protein
MKPFPTVHIDLANVPLATHVVSYKDSIVTLKTKLSGSLDLQKIGTIPSGEISTDGYKMEARNKLGSFFAKMQINKFSEHSLQIGSKINGEYTSSSVTLITPQHFQFTSDLQTMKKKYNGWNINGQMSFVIDTIISPNHPGSALVWNNKVCKDVEVMFASLDIAALGQALAIALEDIGLALLSLAVIAP